jgi:hypothetical protein
MNEEIKTAMQNVTEDFERFYRLVIRDLYLQPRDLARLQNPLLTLEQRFAAVIHKVNKEVFGVDHPKREKSLDEEIDAYGSK